MPRTVHGRNKQHGFRPPALAAHNKAETTEVEVLSVDELLKNKKAELLELAGSLGVAVEPKATKAQIAEAIVAAA